MTNLFKRFWKIPLARELTIVAGIMVVAYGGGYYFGRHPNSLRELLGSKSLVVMTTQENVIPEDLQAWIEDKWGHSIIVQVVGEDEIMKSSLQADLVILPKSAMDPLQSQLTDKPVAIDTAPLLVDLIRKDSKAVPLLWKVNAIGDGFYRLNLLEVGWVSSNTKDNELVQWLLDPEFQKLWSEEMEMNSARRDVADKSKVTSDLRAIPLEKLRYD